MSQKGPAARPSSHPPAASPVKYEQVSPHTRSVQPNHRNGQLENERLVGNGLGPGVNNQGKVLGMYSILNPPEPQGTSRESTAQQRQRRESGQSVRTHASILPAVRGNAEGVSASLPGTPGLGSVPAPSGRQAASEARSQAVAYPFTATNPRKPLSPQSVHGNAAYDVEPRPLQPPPTLAGTKRRLSYAGEETLERKPSIYGHNRLSNTIPNAGGIISPSNIPTQPVRHMDGWHAPPGPPPPADYPRYPEGLYSQSQASYHQGYQGPPHGGSLLTTATSESGPAMMNRPVLGGSVTTSDGQQAYMTLPGTEEPITVRVDYSQASKKADEKRQRNAKASTRHRKKKKSAQETTQRQLHEAEEKIEALNGELETITRQRDFYRSERNRLRDVVRGAPTISQHASGPSSPLGPTSIRSVHSYPDHSPTVGQPRPLHTPTQGYTSDASSLDRPEKRQRTDERAEYMANYSTQSGLPPTTLPPMHGHSQGMPPRPMTTHQERLPPLRAIDGQPPPHEMYAGHAIQERDPATGDWRFAQPRSHETGWALPRKVDSHQR